MKASSFLQGRKKEGKLPKRNGNHWPEAKWQQRRCSHEMAEMMDKPALRQWWSKRENWKQKSLFLCTIFNTRTETYLSRWRQRHQFSRCKSLNRPEHKAAADQTVMQVRCDSPAQLEKSTKLQSFFQFMLFIKHISATKGLSIKLIRNKRQAVFRTIYHILHTAYCMYYTLHVKGTISMPLVHTAVHVHYSGKTDPFILQINLLSENGLGTSFRYRYQNYTFFPIPILLNSF